MRIRTSFASASLAAVAALVLTGCGSDEKKNDDPAKDRNPAADAPKEGGGGDGKIDGGWAGHSDGKPVSLAVTGTKAVLIAEGTTCAGEVADHGKKMLALKCADGSTARSMGTVEIQGDTLVVSWDGGKKDSLKRAAGLPADLPTNLPSLPALPGS
jgi:hypothetical protein